MLLFYTRAGQPITTLPTPLTVRFEITPAILAAAGCPANQLVIALVGAGGQLTRLPSTFDAATNILSAQTTQTGTFVVTCPPATPSPTVTPRAPAAVPTIEVTAAAVPGKAPAQAPKFGATASTAPIQLPRTGLPALGLAGLGASGFAIGLGWYLRRRRRAE